jgi:Sensors of blue-light using FAD
MLIELIYHSLSRQSVSEEAIRQILKTSKDFNSKNDISGYLLYYQNEFLQIIEGEKEIVYALFKKIKSDQRHSNVLLIKESEIKKEHSVHGQWLVKIYHNIRKMKMTHIVLLNLAKCSIV